MGRGPRARRQRDVRLGDVDRERRHGVAGQRYRGRPVPHLGREPVDDAAPRERSRADRTPAPPRLRRSALLPRPSSRPGSLRRRRGGELHAPRFARRARRGRDVRLWRGQCRRLPLTPAPRRQRSRRASPRPRSSAHAHGAPERRGDRRRRVPQRRGRGRQRPCPVRARARLRRSRRTPLGVAHAPARRRRDRSPRGPRQPGYRDPHIPVQFAAGDTTGRRHGTYPARRSPRP